MPPYRQSLRLALPLILSNASAPLLGMVDTAVIGRLPEAHHLGAVALGAAIMSTLMWLHGFLRIGTGGLTAQAFGAGERAVLAEIPARAVLVALLSSLVMLLLSPLLVIGTQILFAPGEAIAAGFEDYLTIRLFGLPAILLTQVAIGWFLGQQRPLFALITMLFANTLNAALDILFVIHLEWGVEGVAAATVIAEYAAVIVALFFARRLFIQLEVAIPSPARILDMAALVRFFRLGRDLVLRTVVMEFVFIGFAAIGSRQGDIILAANAVLMNFFTLQAHGLDGFSDATEAMVGRAVGRRSPHELQDAVRAGFVNGGVLALIITAGFALAGPGIIALLTTIGEVRATAGIYLPYIVILPAVSVWAFIMDGTFFGATRARELRNAMLLAATLFLAASAILAPALGNHGLWIAFLLFMAARGVLLYTIYSRADGGAGFARG